MRSPGAPAIRDHRAPDARALARGAFDVDPASDRHRRLELTTNPGLESLTLAELRERLAVACPGASLRRRRTGIRGRLHVESDAPALPLVGAATELRSIHHVLRPLAAFELDPDAGIGAVERAVRATAVPGLWPDTRFRVTSRRFGEHPFRSVDVERAAGAILVERTGAPVDLTGHDLEVRVDVIERRIRIALQVTREALSFRHPRRYHQRVCLKPNVAYALLRLAGVGPSTRVVADPFCGSGTILLEAGALAPRATLLGSDWNGKAVAGTLENLEATGIRDRARVRQLDFRDLAAEIPESSLDALVTNPPLGQRLGRSIHFRTFYARVLEEARRVVRPGGRVAILARKRHPVTLACRRAGGFRMVATRNVETAGVHPAMVGLERVEEQDDGRSGRAP